MRFEATRIAGCHVIEVDRHSDERGFFARVWCRDELRDAGLVADLAQCSVSFNPAAGTLRGLHFQVAPYEEVKIVRCTRGRLFDVAVDLRPDSKTFCAWVGIELSADNHRMLYIPPGCAHGFLTLEPETEVVYAIDTPWSPEASRGVRWDDPAFGIEWPTEVTVIHPRDAGYPDFRLEAPA